MVEKIFFLSSWTRYFYLVVVYFPKKKEPMHQLFF
jgi:hypothetical protein